MTYRCTAFLLLLTLLGAACRHEEAAKTSTAPPAFDQTKFINFILATSLSDTELGAMAARRGHGPEVRQLGTDMHREQAQLRSDIATVAQKKGIAVTNAIEPRKAALRDNLVQIQYPHFDRGYVLAMVQDLNAEVAQCAAAASSGDADVKAFAGRVLPALQNRQKVATELLDKMGGNPFGYPPGQS